MRQAATQELYSYWNRLRGERLSPERDEIDPQAIRHILADTMILEVDAERQFPVRISGTRLNALFMSEQKGAPFVSLFAPEEREAASAMIVSVLDGARPIVAGLSAAPEGGEAATLELLLLPLRHHGKTHARILGSLTPLAIPSWLGLRQASCLRMISMRFIENGQDGAMPAHPSRSRRGERRTRRRKRWPAARKRAAALSSSYPAAGILTEIPRSIKDLSHKIASPAPDCRNHPAQLDP